MANSATPVRIELRLPGSRPSFHEVTGAEFLLGSVIGCDLILPGGDLPPVFGVIARTVDGVRLRKLAPNFKLTLNGKAVQHAALTNGDSIGIGKAELVVHVPAMAAVQPVAATASAGAAKKTWTVGLGGSRSSPTAAPIDHSGALRQMAQESDRLKQQQREIESRRKALEAEELSHRSTWAEREAQLEAELLLAQERRQAAGQGPLPDPADFETRRRELEAREQSLLHERQQFEASVREHREDLARLDRHRAAADASEREFQVRMVELERREQQAERDAAIIAEKSRQLDQIEQEQSQQLSDRQASMNALAGELATREAMLGAKETELRSLQRQIESQRQLLDVGTQQHKDDLQRLDRLNDALHAQERDLAVRTAQADERAVQLEREARVYQEQSRRASELETQLQAELERVRMVQAEAESNATKLAEQSATSEGQQAILASLRSKMERMREELRAEVRALTEQRARQEELEKQLADKQALLDAEVQARERDRAEFTEQASALQSAVAKLRELQDRVAADEKAITERVAVTDLQASEYAEQANTLREKAAQLLELHHKLEGERAALQERDQALSKAEEARAALQEQLLQRSRELENMRRAAEEQAATLNVRAAALDRDRATVDADLEGLRKDLNEKADELESVGRELEARETQLHQRLERMKEIGLTLAAERKSRAEEKARWEEEHRQAAEDLARTRAELDAYRRETVARAAELQEALPDLELRGVGALERLTHARDQLKSHVAELHDFAKQSRDDLESLREQVQSETERLRAQQTDLGRARSEHRLAVTAFRQQLIDWQGRVGEMKQVIARDGTRLDRRQTELAEAAREIDTTAQQLAQQAAELNQQRGEVEYHLSDMRDWFRRKFKELAESSVVRSPSSVATDDFIDGQPTNDHGRILSMQSELDPGDKTLGELLHSLDLVDDATLSALWLEARRQRRSLRQVLLASGKLTVYQMALIEAGNVDNLTIGPLGVIDRLRITPQESVYRVIDPRPGNLSGPLVLRHLAEAEMHDAVRPDEFRQRFAALAELRHPHIAATIEVLEINDRPAALQEWLTGLTGTDWPSLAASPGVWYRLTCQALLGLATAHQWGLIHGAISNRAVVLTPDGLVKLTGVGEPIWLSGADPTATPMDDVIALGKVASDWAALVPKRKGAKPPRPLPAAVRAVVDRWVNSGYDSAAAVLDDLDRAGTDVPAGVETWERLVKFAGENGSEGVTWRKSA